MAPTVVLRPLAAGDRALIADAFERLSPRSRQLRYLAPMPRLPRRMLDALMAVDGTDHVAWIALAGGRCAGVVRYVRDRVDPSAAELAVEVVDEHQRRGIATALLRALAHTAYAAGVERFTFDLHPENRAAEALARRFGARPMARDGTLYGELPLAAMNASMVATVRSRSAASGRW
jgi:RimJ/RimL family protein N-acetyltransferase